LAGQNVADGLMENGIKSSVLVMRPAMAKIARSRYNLHTAESDNAGAHMTVDEEQIVGKTLSKHAIDCLQGRGNFDFSCACASAGCRKSLFKKKLRRLFLLILEPLHCGFPDLFK
jgi:hypothetical protein